MNETHDPQLESKPYRDKNRWIRVLMAILFGFIYQITEIVFAAVAVFQWIHLLLLGERNHRLNEFANRLTSYMREVLDYICLGASEPPWPIGDSGGDIA